MPKQVYNCDEAGIAAMADAMANQPIKPENKFNSFDELKRSYWRRYFLQPIGQLENQTPTEASKTPNGRAMLEVHLQERERMETSMAGFHSDDNLNVNPPTAWISKMSP